MRCDPYRSSEAVTDTPGRRHQQAKRASMSRPDRLARAIGRSGKMRPFLRLDRDMLRSAEWAALQPYALKLLIDLGAQYTGTNNGDLCATWKFMKACGWRSQATLQRALKELKGAGWLEVTRQGGMHWPTLLALTFFKIDQCGGKLDVSAKPTASHSWRKTNSPLPPQARSASTVVAIHPHFQPRPPLIAPIAVAVGAK